MLSFNQAVYCSKSSRIGRLSNFGHFFIRRCVIERVRVARLVRNKVVRLVYVHAKSIIAVIFPIVPQAGTTEDEVLESDIDPVSFTNCDLITY